MKPYRIQSFVSFLLLIGWCALGLSAQRLEAADWTAQNSGITTNLYGVWGSSATNVFAVGEWGTVLHYNGSSWTVQTSATVTAEDLRSVWGSSTTDVFAVGDGGTILHTSNGGITWLKQDSGTSSSLYGVWGSSATDIFAVGLAGTILHYSGSQPESSYLLWTR